MKCNNAGYGVGLEKETRSFRHPSHEESRLVFFSLESGEDDDDKKSFPNNNNNNVWRRWDLGRISFGRWLWFSHTPVDALTNIIVIPLDFFRATLRLVISILNHKKLFYLSWSVSTKIGAFDGNMHCFQYTITIIVLWLVSLNLYSPELN